MSDTSVRFDCSICVSQLHFAAVTVPWGLCWSGAKGKFPPFLSITPLIDFFGVVTGWPCLLPISDKVGTGFKSSSEVGGRRGETMRLTCLCCWTAVSDLSRSGVDVPSRQTWGHGGVSKTPTSTTHYRPHMCQLCCFFCEVFPPHSLGSFLAKGRFPLFPLVN